MLTVNLGGTAYSITPDGTITPDTVVAQMVGDLLGTGEPIGPQVDEYVGIVGSLDQYPRSVIAAFLDVAARFGLRVGRVELPTDAVTAGLGDGGFDALGNWHDPGSGKFAKKGTSTAKALIENLFRKLLADSKRKDGTDAVMLEAIPSIDLHPGDRVTAKWHDGRVATITAPDGRKVRVSWDLLAHPEAYATVWTGEGRETPMPVVNEMADGPTISGKARWYEATVDGERFSPNVRTAEEPTYMLLARDEFGWYAVGFSAADNETDARADAEVAAPSADEYRIVGDLTPTDAPPPDAIRTGRRPSMAQDDEGYRNHRLVAVNDRTVGWVRQEDRGIDDTTGPWTAVLPDSVEVLGPYDTMIAAVEALAAKGRTIERPTDTSQTFTRQKVSASSVAEVRARVEKLNARAERKGLNGRVEMTVSEPYLAADPAWVSARIEAMSNQEWAHSDTSGIEAAAPKAQVYDVTISATPVRLGGGWEFAGVVDYATLREADQGHDSIGDASPVLLHSAAGYQLPEKFREHAVCDDCGRVMPRNKLIVAADRDGNLTRLGTTCVVDVLGHDPAKLLWWESAVRELSEDDDGMWSKPSEPAWTREDYLYQAIVAIDMFGYRKSGYEDSTRDLIVRSGEKSTAGDSDRLKEYRERLKSLHGTDKQAEFEAKAKVVLDYIHSDAFSKRDEFGQNMAAALTAQFVIRRSAGIAAYAPAAYDRAQEKAEAAKAADEVPNEWIGAAGDKVELTGTVRRINATEGYMGGTSYIVTVDTDQGVVKTFTSGAFSDDAQEALDSGTPIRFKGTIKDHGEYPRGSGNRETTLRNVTTVLTRSARLRQAQSDQEAKVGHMRSDLRRAAPDLADPIEAAPPAVIAAAHDAMITAQAAAQNEPALPAWAGVGDRITASAIERGQPNAYKMASSHRRVVLPDGTMGRLALDKDGVLHVVDLDGNEVISADTITDHAKDFTSNIWSLYAVDPDPERPVDLPWADGDFLVDQFVGIDKSLVVHPDSTVTHPDGSLATGVEHERAWSGAAHITQRRRRDAAKVAEVAAIDAALTAPPTVDDTPTLTPEWIDAGPWPQDYAYGARSKKTYRIEPGGDVYLNDKRVTDKTGDKVLLAALADLGVDKPETFDPTPAAETGVAPIVNELVEPPGPRIVGSAEVSEIAGSAAHATYLAGVRDTPATAVLVDAWRGSLDSPGATRGMQWAAAAAFDRPGTAPLGDTADSDRAWLERTAQSYGITAYDPVSTLRDLHARTQALLADHGVDPDDNVILYRGITTHQHDEWVDYGRPDVMGSAPLAAYSPRFSEAAAVGKGGVMSVRLPAANIVSLGALTSGNDEVIAFPPVGGVPVTRFRSAETDAAAAMPSFRERIEAMRDESLASRDDLSRFIDAQAKIDPVAELRSGRKVGHWMWYVFPQIGGLSESAAGKRFEIRSLDQARKYVAHPVLGPRLIEVSRAMLDASPGKGAAEILGRTVDAMKLRSSMTLFARAAPDQPVFQQVLDRFFDGEPDAATVKILDAMPVVNELAEAPTAPVTNRSMIELDRFIDSLGEPVEKVKGFKPDHREKLAMKYAGSWEPSAGGPARGLDVAEKMGKPTIRTPEVRSALRDIASALPDDTEIKVNVLVGMKPDKLHGVADALRHYGKDTLAALGLVGVYPSDRANGKAMASVSGGTARRPGSRLYIHARGHSITPTAAENQGNWVTVALAKTPREAAEMFTLHEMGHVVHYKALANEGREMHRLGVRHRGEIHPEIANRLTPDLAAVALADREAKRNMTRYGRSDTAEAIAEAHVLAVTGNAAPWVDALARDVWAKAALNPGDMPDLSGSYYSPEYVSDLAAGEEAIAERTDAEQRVKDIARLYKFTSGTLFQVNGVRFRRAENGFVREATGDVYRDAAELFDVAPAKPRGFRLGSGELG